MKHRTTLRPKLVNSSELPPTTLRKLEEIGRDIAGLRSELDKLAAAQARHPSPKPPRDPHK